MVQEEVNLLGQNTLSGESESINQFIKILSEDPKHVPLYTSQNHYHLI